MTLQFFIMSATPFTKTGALDEDAFRLLLGRMIDAKLGLYLGSAGCGEGHALTMAELDRVYRIGVEEARGKVEAHANIPEQHTADGTIEHAKLAIAAGIQVVHLYTVEGRHGMKPTDDELMAYFDDVFAEVKHPVAIAMNPLMGYIPRPAMIAKICQKHRQIVTVRLTGTSDAYLIELMDRIGRQDINYYVRLGGSMNALTLGRTGVFGTKASIIPKTFQRYHDLFEQRKYEEMAEVYAQLIRFNEYIQAWNPGSPRWIKMAMKVLKLPGGEGGPRKPYLLPPADELDRFRDGLLKLGIPEIDEIVRADGKF